MSDARQHHLPAGYPVSDGQLLIGGRPAMDWIAELGSPLFLYDCHLIDSRLKQLRAALPAQVRIHYAMKANPHPGVVRHLAANADGLDVASAGELAIALAAGGRSQSISFAGPGKRDFELDAALAAGVLINLESETEMARVAARAATLGVQARVAVRINPDFELKGAGLRMGGRAQPFGVDAERVPAMLQALAAPAFSFEGLHAYLGSQTLAAPLVIEAQRKTLDMMIRLLPLCPVPPRSLNIGGGFGIPYFPGDQPLDLAGVGQFLAIKLSKYSDILKNTEIVLELGRYLVGEAGVYLTRVVDRKVSYGQIFLVTDGGMHHQLAASGNLGQVLRRNYPVVIASRMAAPSTERVNVVGCLCTPLDLLADRMLLPHAEPGDVVAIFQAGAYGATSSPAGFLSHAPATEHVIEG